MTTMTLKRRQIGERGREGEELPQLDVQMAVVGSLCVCVCV